MLKSVAWTAVIVGSLGAAMACSSKSSGGNNFGGEDASNDEDGGGSSSSSSGGTSEAGPGCANPLGAVELITHQTASAACMSCVNSTCSSALSTCMAASSCTSTQCLGLGECVETSCASCLPDAGSTGSSSSGGSDGGSSSGSSSGGASDGGAPYCTMLMGCCSGLALLAAADSSLMSLSNECTSTANSGNNSTCETLYTMVSTYCGGSAGH
jgi:hypothetical protein